jgi:hypothetical protein
VVLSIVAITLSILVDRRASQVNDQTIKSLQKIESAVERSSGDTRELIKAAWDKLLGGYQTDFPKSSENSAQAVAKGIASELRKELNLALPGGSPGSVVDPQREERLKKVVDNLETSLAALLEHEGKAVPLGRAIDVAVATITQIMMGHHLTRDQYERMEKLRACGPALMELRAKGLIVPVSHKHSSGKTEPCYYFAPGIASALRAAMTLIPQPPRSVVETVHSELHDAGYFDSTRPENEFNDEDRGKTSSSTTH